MLYLYQQIKKEVIKMTVTNIKKYSLTDKEIEVIQTTLGIVKVLGWENFDSYGDFHGSSLCFTDVQEFLQIILENNNKNLE